MCKSGPLCKLKGTQDSWGVILKIIFIKTFLIVWINQKPISPYVCCVIGNVAPTCRCVENTTGSKTRSTDTRYLRFAKKCCCQNLEWDHLRSISVKWNTSPPRPWHSDVERHVPWWKIKLRFQQFLRNDRYHWRNVWLWACFSSTNQSFERLCSRTFS